MASTRCEDVLGGISIAQSNKAINYLPQSMRDTLVEGLQACLALICEAAWDYYRFEDVPINDQTIPLLRTIVSYHLINEGG